MAHLIRMSVIGAMPSGEEWSVNPVFSLPGGGTTVTPAQATAIAIAAAASAAPSGVMAVMNPATNIHSIRVEARTLAGVLETQAQATKATPQYGTGSSAHPFQTSWVVSLRTAAVGARGRGRLYWPATGQVIDADTLRPIAGSVAAFLTGAQTYLTNLRNVVQTTITGADLAVWSRATPSLNEVNALQVGDVLDTQRRRRDTLVETYQQTLFV